MVDVAEDVPVPVHLLRETSAIFFWTPTTLLSLSSESGRLSLPSVQGTRTACAEPSTLRLGELPLYVPPELPKDGLVSCVGQVSQDTYHLKPL